MKYAVQRYGSWEWLDLDAPLRTDGPEWALSTWGVMTATLTPEQAQQTALDGRPVFEEWGTLIHAETGDTADRRRWTGIVARSEVKGASHELRIVEFPGYSDGVPVDALIRGTGTDPAVLLRAVWQAIQAYPNSWLNVDVLGETPVRLGTDLDDKAAIAHAVMVARKETLDALQGARQETTAELQDLTNTLGDEVAAARAQVVAAQSSLNGLFATDAPQGQIDDAKSTLTARQAALTALETTYQAETAAGRWAVQNAASTVEAARVAHDEAKEAYQAAAELAKEQGGAYEIRPEDLTDAAKAIADLVRSSGIEWTTAVDYSEGPPQCYIRVHYPRAGTRRDDLIFEQGENVISELNPVREGSEYANSGYGIGAGEGPDAVRATIENPSPRLRRPVTVEDRSLHRVDQLQARLRAEVERLDGEPYVSQITVIDHDYAPIGSWQVGDIITVTGQVPHLGAYRKPHRIISWKYQGETRAELRLAPAR